MSFIFGTVGSPISSPKKPGGSPGAIQHIRTLNLGALELGWVQAVRVSEDTCRIIAAAGQEYQVAISVHAPYFINLNADSDEWPKSRQRLMDAAHYGWLAGATDIIFHPGSYFGNTPADVLKIAIPRLAECVKDLRAAGNPVTLRPETMGKSALFGSLMDTIEMATAIPGVLPCIDFAHLHARNGDGSLNTHPEFRALLENYKSHLGTDSLSKLHIHLSGIEYGPKGEKNHLPIEESDLHLKELFTALKELGCGGRILCESPKMEEDALLMQSTWQDIQ